MDHARIEREADEAFVAFQKRWQQVNSEAGPATSIEVWHHAWRAAITAADAALAAPSEPMKLPLEQQPGFAGILCACKDRPLGDCPGQWEPGCDLGANAAHVRVALPAAQPVARPLTREVIREMLADTREVFDASGPETPQDVRDVIEYVTSWLEVYADKAASAAPAPQAAQPVAWLYHDAPSLDVLDDLTHSTVLSLNRLGYRNETPLYAAPALPAAQPVSEPIMVEAVAEVRSNDDGLYLDWLIEGGICALGEGCVLVMPTRPITGDDGSGEVYAAPAPQAAPQPLTDEQIDRLGTQAIHGGPDSQYAFRFARAIERAHGITKEKF